MNQQYVHEVKGKLCNSDESKTIHIPGMANDNEAMDYAAMFHSIDEIEHIKHGYLVKGAFVEE
jgi:hypothetical protein